MNDTNQLDPREQLDLLISRIADGEAGESDWRAFNDLAERRPEAWKHLAQAQREHASMSLAVGVALAAADRVDLPSIEAAELFAARRNAPVRIRTLSRLGAFSGWAAAAVVAIMAWNGAFTLRPRTPANSPAGNNVASVIPAGWTLNTPDDAVNAYLDIGRKSGNVVGELPSRVVVNSQPVLLDGGQQAVRVMYIRQFVEQTVVTDLGRMTTDEAGRPIVVPMSPVVPVSGPQ